jgi:hypothetical protein
VLATARDPEASKELFGRQKKFPKHTALSLQVASAASIQDLADELDGKPIDVRIYNSGS